MGVADALQSAAWAPWPLSDSAQTLRTFTFNHQAQHNLAPELRRQQEQLQQLQLQVRRRACPTPARHRRRATIYPSLAPTSATALPTVATLVRRGHAILRGKAAVAAHP